MADSRLLASCVRAREQLRIFVYRWTVFRGRGSVKTKQGSTMLVRDTALLVCWDDKKAWKEKNNIPFSFQHAAGINIAKYTAQPTSESDTSVTGNMWADCRRVSLEPAETIPLWAPPASHSPLYISMWQDSDSSRSASSLQVTLSSIPPSACRWGRGSRGWCAWTSRGWLCGRATGRWGSWSPRWRG